MHTQNCVKDRQEEGCGLARAGLGAPHQIPLGLHDRDGILLDGRGLLVPRFVNVFQEYVSKICLLEGVDLLGWIFSRNFRPDFVEAARIYSVGHHSSYV